MAVGETSGSVVSCGQTTHRPVTMAMAKELERAGLFGVAELARIYAVDRPRWWHRFLKYESTL